MQKKRKNGLCRRQRTVSFDLDYKLQPFTDYLYLESICNGIKVVQYQDTQYINRLGERLPTAIYLYKIASPKNTYTDKPYHPFHE